MTKPDMTPGERIVSAWDGWGADFSESLKVNLAKSIDEVIAERVRNLDDAIATERTIYFGNGWNAAVEACANVCAVFDRFDDEGHPVRPEGSVAGADVIAAAIRALRI